MYFKTRNLINPETGKSDISYRIVESYRNPLGEVRQRTVLSAGFIDHLSAAQLNEIIAGLNARIKGEQLLFEDSCVKVLVDTFYARMVKEKKIDRLLSERKKDGDWETVDLNSIQSKDAREMGSEWIVSQAIEELGITGYLRSRSWSEERIALAKTHLIARTVYPASELESVRYIHENSSVCEITGYPKERITRHHLYGVSKDLYKEKEGLEVFLSKKTNELFDLQDRIIIYDLTDTYFEGAKRNSGIARHGRSKEKRSDCPLVVLALVVNVEGFVKYSSIYKGNMSDPLTLEETINTLCRRTSDKRGIVVLDAGIATEANLEMLNEKGYRYVCVSRKRLKKYEVMEDTSPVIVKDNKNREIELQRVVCDIDSEYFLKVKSDAKSLKEAAMNNSFRERFEEGLQVIAKGVSSKGGTKKYDKVCERIGRLKQRYPSVHRFYDIRLEKNDKDICTSITWNINEEAVLKKEDDTGVYFIRTNMEEPEEELVWMVYNCIRNVESAFRCIKSDLNLRPIYHKTDEATEAHLHLGLLAYWVVNTIRHKLKSSGINSSWKEVNRIMHTQKCVTTTMVNVREQVIAIRRCTEPTPKVKLIYDALRYRYAPFIRKKSVVPKTDIEKKVQAKNQEDTS